MAYLEGHLLGVETALPAEPPVWGGVDEADMAMDERGKEDDEVNARWLVVLHNVDKCSLESNARENCSGAGDR